jgi:hypothetical protein
LCEPPLGLKEIGVNQRGEQHPREQSPAEGIVLGRQQRLGRLLQYWEIAEREPRRDLLSLREAVSSG